MKRIVLGILAHVDAGKTTLSEGLLYSSGAISRLGRVDKRDVFLDTHELERERGITIFSKQAIFSYGDTEFTLIDTPGHIDFSAEAERAVAIQDAAILVISATDGVTAHTKTLWNLLSAKGVPTFIFVNKTDISDRRRDMIMDELRALLSGGCVDFTADGTADFYENVAATDERLMDEYFSTDSLKVDSVIKAIKGRRVFPCMFGSALKMKGVEELLSTIVKYAPEKKYPENLGAKVYKISRDAQGKRLSYMKIVGGTLRNKDLICHTDKEGREVYEKAEEIRLYSADKYKSVGEASGGQVVAVLGLASTFVARASALRKATAQPSHPFLTTALFCPRGQTPTRPI